MNIKVSCGTDSSSGQSASGNSVINVGSNPTIACNMGMWPSGEAADEEEVPGSNPGRFNEKLEQNERKAMMCKYRNIQTSQLDR